MSACVALLCHGSSVWVPGFACVNTEIFRSGFGPLCVEEREREREGGMHARGKEEERRV